MTVELRDEPPDGPAARGLWAEYMALVADRLDVPVASPEVVFATPEAFADGAWLVLYEDGRPVACGGLRVLGGGAGEIKRMFVTAGARGRGHGRRLLAALESRARAEGLERMRLLTTDVLIEARSLYLDAGYEIVSTPREGDRQDYWMEKLLP